MTFIIIFIASAAGVAALVGLAAWAKIERPRAPLDRRSALAFLAEEAPDRAIEALWISEDGEGAIGRSGDVALVAFRMGDSYAARAVPWSVVEAGRRAGTAVRVRLGDIAAPKATFKLAESAAWPPRMEAPS